MIETIEGIVINVKNYSESSRIIDIFTKEHGVISVIAKNCRSLKSKLRIFTEKMVYASFTIYYKKDKLSTLTEASIINDLSNIKKDILKISYAGFIIDLARQVYKQNNSEQIYKLLISSIIKINENLNPLVITNILELKYLYYLGIMPNLDGCVVCGSKDVITLSSSKGGFLCPKCKLDDPICSTKAIKLIKMYFYVDIDKISKLEINNSVVYEVNNFIDEYYDRYSGLYLKSKTFLKKIVEV